MDKFVGVKWPASQPDQPHCFQDLALCVKPPVPDSLSGFEPVREMNVTVLPSDAQ